MHADMFCDTKNRQGFDSCIDTRGLCAWLSAHFQKSKDSKLRMSGYILQFWHHAGVSRQSFFSKKASQIPLAKTFPLSGSSRHIMIVIGNSIRQSSVGMLGSKQCRMKAKPYCEKDAWLKLTSLVCWSIQKRAERQLWDRWTASRCIKGAEC